MPVQFFDELMGVYQTMKYQYHKDGTHAKENQIFVFGSNLSGIHGAGAALAAHERYGAVWGEGVGIKGSSYAIPTKDEQINTMQIEHIKTFIDAFVLNTHILPNASFFVTRVGCGLAGFSDSDIAPLFRGCNTNCNFAEEWKEYLEE